MFYSAFTKTDFFFFSSYFLLTLRSGNSNINLRCFGHMFLALSKNHLVDGCFSLCFFWHTDSELFNTLHLRHEHSRVQRFWYNVDIMT